MEKIVEVEKIIEVEKIVEKFITDDSNVNELNEKILQLENKIKEQEELIKKLKPVQKRDIYEED